MQHPDNQKNEIWGNLAKISHQFLNGEGRCNSFLKILNILNCVVDFFLYRKNTFKCLFEVKHIFLDVGHIGEENHGGWKVDNNTKQTPQHDEIAEV